MKKYGKSYEKEWIEAWESYTDAKKTAQVIIRKKYRKEEQAQASNNMPRREGMLRRNLIGTHTHQEIRLKADGKEITSEKEISEIKRLWKK